ncbi:MAG: hypothetical protein U1F66_05900 [bacterium]
MGNGADQIDRNQASGAQFTEPPWEEDAKAGAPKASPPAPQAHPITPQELQKFAQLLAPIGVDLGSCLDAQGQLKPEKLAAARSRVAEAIRLQVEKAQGMGAKATWPVYFKKTFLPALLRDSEFPLLPKEAQISLLKEAGIEGKEEILEVLQRPWADPAKRFAHFLRLQARAAEAEGKPLFHCARLYEKAAALDGEDLSLALAASRAKLNWAETVQEPQSRKVLFDQALAQVEGVLKKDPDNLAALSQKGEILTLLGRPQEAIRLYDSVLEKKGTEDRVVASYDLENLEALDARSIHLAAAHAMQTWAERAAQDPSLEKIHGVLSLEALGHLQSILERHPEDRLALEEKARILTTLGKELAAAGKSEESERVLSEAQAAQGVLLRGKIRDALAAAESGEEAEQAKAKVRLEALLPELKDLLQREPLARRLADWRLEMTVCGRLSKKEEFDEAKAQLRAGMQELRDSLRLQDGAKSTAEQLEGAKALAEADVLEKDSKALAEDLELWTRCIDAAPPELLSSKEKLDQYFEVFRRLHSVKGQVEDVPDRMEALRSKIIDFVDHAEDLIPQKEARYAAGTRIGEILETLIHAEGERAAPLLELLTPEKLMATVEPKVRNDLAYQKALELKEPGERRAALLLVLQGYGEQKDRDKVEEILRLLQEGLPFSPDDPGYLPERLKVHSAIVAATHACGLEIEEKYRTLCQQEVQILRAQVEQGATGTGTVLSPSQKISDLLLIRGFYGEAGDAQGIEDLTPLLGRVRAEGEAQLAGGEPPLAAKERVALAGQLAQLRWLLFDSDVKARRTQWSTEAQDRQVTLEELQGSLARWREELAGAPGLEPEWKYEQARELFFFTASLGEARQAGDRLFEGEALASELQAAKALLKPLLAEGLKPALEEAKPEAELQSKILADLEGILARADPENPESMARLAGLDFAGLSEFAKLDLAGHRQLKKSQDALGGKEVSAWIRDIKAGKADAKDLEAGLQAAQEAAQAFAVLGLQGNLETAMQPALALARCPEVPAEERCRCYLQAGQVFLGAGMKAKALELLQEVAALDGKGASPQIHQTAQLAKGIQLLNSDPPRPDEAMAIFRGLPDNEIARGYLEGITSAQRGNCRAQSFQLIQTVMLHHAAVLRGEGHERQAAGIEKAIGPFLRQVERKLDLGECKTLEQAIEAVSQEKAFNTMPGFLLESWAGNAILGFAKRVSDFNLKDGEFLRAALGMGESLAREGDPYDISPELKAIFENDPKAKRPLEAFVAKLPSLKSFSHIAEALQYSTPFGVAFFSPNFSSVKNHWMGLIPGFVGGALGKYAFKSAFLGLVGNRLSAGFGKSAGTFLAEETGMTVGMTFGRMGAQLLLTGKLEGLTWDSFWSEMGSNLLMSLCLRGMGAGVQKLGTAASRLPWLRAPGAQGLGVAALSPMAQKALGTLGYVGSVTAIAGSEKLAEGLGVREEEGLDFFTMMFRAWVTQIEMGSAHQQTELLKGVLVGRLAPAAPSHADAGSAKGRGRPVPGAPSRKAPTDQDVVQVGGGYELPVTPDVVVLDPQNKQAKGASGGRVALREGDIVETGKPGDSDFQRQVFQSGKLKPLGQEPVKIPMPSAPPRSPFHRNLATDQSPGSLRARIAAAGNLSELKKLVRDSALPGAQTEFRLLESCLRGETDSQRLAPGLRERALELMGKYAQEFSRKLPNQHVPTLVNEASLQLPAEEIRYRACRELGLLMDKTAGARNIDQLIAAVQSSPLAEPEGISKQDLLQKLQDYKAGKILLQEMPRGFGLRQKLRDFNDAEIDRFYEAGQTDSFPLPADPAAQAKVKNLDDLAGDLYKSLPKAGFQGEWKSFSPLKVVETLHEVLERGKPLERITVEQGLRSKVMAQMYSTVEAARQLYPAEWAKIKASRRNFFTGEALAGDPDGTVNLANNERALQTVYRFARMLLNEKSGRPIFGMPSFPERKALRDFAISQLHGGNVKDFADAQAVLRDHMTRMTPEFQQAFQRANPSTRALLMEAFFGSTQHRQMESPQQAFQLAKFLSQCGMYRELGVTLEFDGAATYTNLSLGEYGSVNPETNRMVFVMHTHPEEYLGSDGRMMTQPVSRRGPAKTLVMDEGTQSPDSRNVVFSEADVDCFIATAEYLYRYRQGGGRADTSVVYDPVNRVFRNWMQNVHGLALLEVQLDPTGNAQEVRVRYAHYARPGLDQSHLRQAQNLRDHIAQQYHLSHDIQQVRPQEVEASMPQ